MATNTAANGGRGTNGGSTLTADSGGRLDVHSGWAMASLLFALPFFLAGLGFALKAGTLGGLYLAGYAVTLFLLSGIAACNSRCWVRICAFSANLAFPRLVLAGLIGYGAYAGSTGASGAPAVAALVMLAIIFFPAYITGEIATIRDISKCRPWVAGLGATIFGTIVGPLVLAGWWLLLGAMIAWVCWGLALQVLRRIVDTARAVFA